MKSSTPAKPNPKAKPKAAGKFNLLSHDNRRDGIAVFKMTFPVLGLVIGGIYFHEFVVHAVEANVIINSGIIGAAAYGVLLIIIRLISAMRDFRVIERFGREAAKGTPMQTLLEEHWVKKRYVKHYLAHVANTGGMLSSALDQNAIEHELHALQAEYDSRSELPQFLVGFMIAMGLLGTFIGLLETLTGISGMLDGMGGGGDMDKQFMHLVSELRKPLAGMGIAFSASMFGLITSLMLAIMMTNLRRYISRVISLARNVMHELVDMARAAPQPAYIPQPTVVEDGGGVAPGIAVGDMGGGGGGAGGNAVARSGGGGGSGNVSSSLVAGRIDLLAKKIELLMESFEASMGLTKKTNDLLSFGPRMREVSERTLEEIKLIGTKHQEHQALYQTLIDVNTNVMRTATAMLDMQRQTKDVTNETLAAIKNVTLGLTEQHQISREIINVENYIAKTNVSILETQKQVVESGEHVWSEIRGQSASHSEQHRLTQALVDMGGQSARLTESLIEGQKQGLTEHAGYMQTLSQRLTRLEEVHIGAARHSFDIKETLTKMSKSLSIVDMVASSISGQSLLLETLVEETRNTQKAIFVLNETLKTQALKDKASS